MALSYAGGLPRQNEMGLCACLRWEFVLRNQTLQTSQLHVNGKYPLFYLEKKYLRSFLILKSIISRQCC